MRIFYTILLSLAFVGCGSDDPVDAANNLVDETIGDVVDDVEEGIDDVEDDANETAATLAARTQFTTSCGTSVCHGTYDNPIRNVSSTTTPAQYASALANVSTMSILSGDGGRLDLTDDQIASALSAVE